MKVNLEEGACLVLAFALLAGNIALIGLIDWLSTEEQAIPVAILQFAAITVLCFLAMVAVYKIPHSWWFRIVYESANKDEVGESDEDSEFGYLH